MSHLTDYTHIPLDISVPSMGTKCALCIIANPKAGGQILTIKVADSATIEQLRVEVSRMNAEPTRKFVYSVSVIGAYV